MRHISLIFVFSYILCLNSYSQNGVLERDSLPVFIIKDKEVAAIVDSFIVDVQHIDYHCPAIFVIYINLYDNGSLSLNLDSRKQKEHSDSIILYKHPDFHQAFILHRNILFQANFMSYFDATNYCKLTELLEKQQIKQCVYFKEPPPRFYDTSRKGEIDYEDNLIGWLYDYHNGQWESAIKVYYIEDKTRKDLRN